MTARLFTVRDFTILKKLQSKLNAEAKNNKFEKFFPYMKSLRHCMARSNCGLGVDVGKTSNGKLALRGITYCHNTWACPSCTPRAMQKLSEKLKAAYTMLKARGYEARMITFTVPHRNRFTNEGLIQTPLEKVLQFLRETFNSFLSGTLKHVRPKDCYTFQIFEVTHGFKSGWHPHIHAIYWFKKEEWKAFLEKEDDLINSWKWHCRKIADKMFHRGDFNQVEYEETIGPLEISQDIPVYISKHVGDVYRYFNDGLAQEVTSLHVKQAKGGNLTVWQILDKAVNNNDEKYWRLFLEYCKATRRIQRWRFKRGFVSEIESYMKEHPAPTISKKKPAEDAATVTQVAWFTPLQWNSLNMRCKNFLPLLAFIVTRFDVDTAYKLLCRLCEKYSVQIPLRQNPLRANDASAWAA